MTVSEISNFLNISKNLVRQTIKRLSESHVSIKNKYNSNGILISNISFTDSECRLIFRELKATKMQQLLLEEYFEYLENSDYYVIEGTQNFLKKWNKGERPKCCNTCIHLSGDKRKSYRAQPYCSFYDCSLDKLKIKVYRDFCAKYEFNNLDRPIKWFTDKAPANLDKFGDPILNSSAGLPDLSSVEKSNPTPFVGFF